MMMTETNKRWKFADIWETKTIFKNEYKASDLYDDELSDDDIKRIYSLLLARYGMSHILDFNVEIFKDKLFSIIFQYAPSWVKQIKLQKDARALTIEEASKGTKQIYNTAENPSDAPSTSSLEELSYINRQSTASVKRGKVDSILMINDIINADYTKIFLDRFKNLFNRFVTSKAVNFFTKGDEETDEEQ